MEGTDTLTMGNMNFFMGALSTIILVPNIVYRRFVLTLFGLVLHVVFSLHFVLWALCPDKYRYVFEFLHVCMLLEIGALSTTYLILNSFVILLIYCMLWVDA